jgi:hypothetical protein
VTVGVSDETATRRRARVARTIAACAVALAIFVGATLATVALLNGHIRRVTAWFPAKPPAVSTSGVDPSVLAGDAPATPPTRVRIPAINVDTTLEALHLDKTGALQAPAKFTDAGWYADGTAPGDIGPAVIAGHIDSKSGPAIFYRLAQLKAGDLVEVARGGQWVAFRVVTVGQYPKNAFPTGQVYGPTPDPQLRLITCGGVFDRTRKSYKDNTVVYAVEA